MNLSLFFAFLPLLIYQPRDIAFVGDSLTSMQPGYVDIVHVATLDTAWRFYPKHLDKAIEDWALVIATQPDIVVIELGIHHIVGCDPTPDFGIAYSQVLFLATQTAEQVIAINIPALWKDEGALALVRERNREIEKLAALYDVRVVDSYSLIDGCEECIGEDGFHPSLVGYQRIADAVLIAIREESLRISSPTDHENVVEWTVDEHACIDCGRLRRGDEHTSCRYSPE